MVVAEDEFDPVLRDIFYDPQTSGGLLVGCREEDVEALLGRLHDCGVEESALVGYVTEGADNKIQIR